MVEVQGNLDNLQSNIDFYLRIISKDSDLDSKIMKNKFFDMFDEEDKYRKENFLVYQERVTDDYKIAENSSPDLVGEECEFDTEVNYFKTEENESEVEEVYDSSVNYFNTEKKVESEAEDEVADEVVKEVAEDDDFISGNYEEKADEAVDDSEEDDDFITENYEEIEDYPEESEKESNSDFKVQDKVEEDDDFVTENYEEKDGGVDEYEDIGNAWGNWDSEEEVNGDENASEPEEEYEDYSNWGNDEELKEFTGNDEQVIHEDVVKNVVEKVEKPKEEKITEVPKDLREFIKQNPNCEVSTALKYFSKKEIDRQLNLGRVFKRKNKLMI